jgi:hypothetical protein
LNADRSVKAEYRRQNGKPLPICRRCRNARVVFDPQRMREALQGHRR